jgi:hypothetical protein
MAINKVIVLGKVGEHGPKLKPRHDFVYTSADLSRPC